MKKTVKDYLFVGVQILLFFAFLADLKVLRLSLPRGLQIGGAALFFVGLLIAVAGALQLSTNLSPFPSPRPGAHLVETGLYEYVRHPIYSGIIVAGIGLGIATNSGTRIGVALLLLVLFYYKSVYEEERMKRIYHGYEEYQRKTNRFFPGI